MTGVDQFSGFARLIHWTMAALILAMLFIGIGMVTSPTRYDTLVTIHRPIGAAILALAAIRLVYRLLHRPPPLPRDLPAVIRISAGASHVALYLLMFAVPLVGWGMLSAGAYPVELYGSLRLPPLLAHDIALYATLRHAHTTLALLLFIVFLVHLGAALAHALLFRDGVFESMASVKQRRPPTNLNDVG